MSTTILPYNIKVFLEDTDAGGFVYHANYLKYFERARTVFFYFKGIDHAQLIKKHQLMCVVRSSAIDYLAPAYLADDLSVLTEIEEITGARIKLKQSIVRGGQVLVKADIVLACIYLNGRVTRIPNFMTDILT